MNSAQPNNVQPEDTEWGRALERPEDVDYSTCPESSSEEQVDIAIVGGGLVGLAVAIGLTRRGISCKVYERAPQLRSQSQGILSLKPNGLDALEKIHPEIPGLVEQSGCVREKIVFSTIDADGNTTEQIIDQREDSIKYGRLKVGMTWHNMQQILASLLPPGLVVTSRSLQMFVEEEDSVRLYFENNKSVVKARAVIACDGVFSAARRQMFPNDKPIFFGQLNWATIIETDKLPQNSHPPKAVRYFQHEGEPRWMSMLSDGGSGFSFWQLRVADPEIALSLSGNNGRGGLGLSGVKEGLLRVTNMSRDVHAVVEAIPESQIFERSIVGRYPLETWRSKGGRVTLIGDSAHGMHPNIASGANTAFESAAALVSALEEVHRDGSDDWKTAFVAFETDQKPKADLIQAFSNMAGISQATGVELVSRAVSTEMLDWILKGKRDLENYPPPADVVKIAKTFDPCDYPGVSPLW